MTKRDQTITDVKDIVADEGLQAANLCLTSGLIEDCDLAWMTSRRTAGLALHYAVAVFQEMIEAAQSKEQLETALLKWSHDVKP